jgi:hypothetical protein
VLHRAAAKREQTKVDGIILAAKAGVVADGLWFGKAGKVKARALEAGQA